MKVLVIGGGGREHALAWKLSQSPRVSSVLCAPGNPGMQGIQAVALSDPQALCDLAIEQRIDLTMVGPEAPLCEGIVDLFRSRGLRIVGPDRQAARLEGSKAFAKDFLARHGIPRNLGQEAINVAREQGRFTIFALVAALTRLTQKTVYAGDRAEADAKVSSLLTLAA